VFSKVLIAYLLLWHLCLSVRGGAMTKAKKEKMQKTGRYQSKDPRNGKKMPKKASKRVQKAWELLMSKDSETIRCYGVGYRVLWSVPACRKRMKRNGFKPPGEYDKNTLMDGKVYGTPAEASFLTGKMAADVLHHASEQIQAREGESMPESGIPAEVPKERSFPRSDRSLAKQPFPVQDGKAISDH